MEGKGFWWLLAVLSAGYIVPSYAIEPASVTTGPLAVKPQLSIQLGHNDNLFLDRRSAESSMITVINPSVELLAERKNDAYRLTYSIEDGQYANSRADDYTDQSLTAEAILELNSRHRVDVTGSYIKEHEDRGSNNAAAGDKPSRYTDKSLGFSYLYGAEGAIANVELTGSYIDHEYDNFKALNEGRDRENSRIGGIFYYRVAPKTSGLVELRYEDVAYDLSTSTLDNVETKYLLGVKWDATAKTSGTAKLGYMEKKYDSSARKDQDSLSWEVAARWSPLTYSVFDIAATQDFEEASGNEDAIDTQSYSLAWTHAWNDRLSTNIMLNRMDEEYTGISREDQTDTITLGANYELQRWLAVNLAYTHTDRASDLDDGAYKREQLMLTISASF